MIDEVSFYTAIITLFDNFEQIDIRASKYTESSVKILNFLKQKCRASDLRNQKILYKLWSHESVKENVKAKLLLKSLDRFPTQTQHVENAMELSDSCVDVDSIDCNKIPVVEVISNKESCEQNEHDMIGLHEARNSNSSALSTVIAQDEKGFANIAFSTIETDLKDLENIANISSLKRYSPSAGCQYNEHDLINLSEDFSTVKKPQDKLADLIRSTPSDFGNIYPDKDQASLFKVALVTGNNNVEEPATIYPDCKPTISYPNCKSSINESRTRLLNQSPEKRLSYLVRRKKTFRRFSDNSSKLGSKQLVIDIQKRGRGRQTSGTKQTPLSKNLMNVIGNEKRFQDEDVLVGNLTSAKGVENVPTCSKVAKAQSSQSYRRKLLWAVSTSLTKKKINSLHPKFRTYATTLAKVVSILFVGTDEERTSTSDMIRIADKHVTFVIQGKTVDEICLNTKMRKENLNGALPKLSGYVPPDHYKKLNLNSEANVFLNQLPSKDAGKHKEETNADRCITVLSDILIKAVDTSQVYDKSDCGQIIDKRDDRNLLIKKSTSDSTNFHVQLQHNFSNCSEYDRSNAPLPSDSDNTDKNMVFEDDVDNSLSIPNPSASIMNHFGDGTVSVQYEFICQKNESAGHIQTVSNCSNRVDTNFVIENAISDITNDVIEYDPSAAFVIQSDSIILLASDTNMVSEDDMNNCQSISDQSVVTKHLFDDSTISHEIICQANDNSDDGQIVSTCSNRVDTEPDIADTHVQLKRDSNEKMSTYQTKKNRPYSIQWTNTNESILVNATDWKQIYDGHLKTLRTAEYVEYFAKKLNIDKNIPCVIKSSKKYGKKKLRTILLNCSHPECERRYKLTCNILQLRDNCFEFVIFHNDGRVKHNDPGTPGITRHLRGGERSRVAEIVAKEYSKDYRDKTIAELNHTLYHQGNLQDIKSDDVIRKVRQVKLHEKDLDRDDVEDMRQAAKKQERSEPGYETKYIRRVSAYPFSTYLFSDDQVNILIDLAKRDPELTVYFDATGSVIRTIQFDDSRMYYYAGVVPLRNYFVGSEDENSVTFPFCEMASNTHTTEAIQAWMKNFKSHFQRTHPTKWPIFKHAVTDFSFATINAICDGFNSMELMEYINVTYDFLHKTNPVNMERCSKCVHVHLCCCHLMKTITRDIDKDFPLSSKETKKLLKEIIAGMFNVSDYEQMKYLWKSLSYLLECPKQNKFSENALRKVSLCIVNQEFTDTEESLRLDQELEKITNEYSKSKYYQEFKQLQVTKTSQIGKNSNPFYNQKFAEKLLKKYISILPMWTPLLCKGRNSNANVEIYFKCCKKRLQQNAVELGEPPLKCSRFFNDTRKYIIAKANEYWLQVPKKRCTKLAKNNRIKQKVQKRKAKVADNDKIKQKVKKNCIKNAMKKNTRKHATVETDLNNQHVEVWNKNIVSKHKYFNADELTNLLNINVNRKTEKLGVANEVKKNTVNAANTKSNIEEKPKRIAEKRKCNFGRCKQRAKKLKTALAGPPEFGSEGEDDDNIIRIDYRSLEESWFKTPLSSKERFGTQKQVSEMLRKNYVPRRLIASINICERKETL